MLVRIADTAEAVLAAVADVDAVELRLSAADMAIVSSVRAVFPGIIRMRCAAGELSQALVDAAAAVPVNEIAFDLDTLSHERSLSVPPELATVAIVDAATHRMAEIASVKGQANAIVLETAGSKRLVDAAAIDELDAFAFACRAAALPFGLGGGLEPPDVARLLLLEPDMLAFDHAVRHGHHPDGELDQNALEAIRALIPRRGMPEPRGRRGLVALDRIFVRDLVVALSIGAYRAEQQAKQRVRFCVEADVMREPATPHDMRDVFSYDVIIETIRVLARRPHVVFVETLAEEIAGALIAHPSLNAVTVKVEKLDVIEGSVGIEITRRRAG